MEAVVVVEPTPVTVVVTKFLLVSALTDLTKVSVEGFAYPVTTVTLSPVTELIAAPEAVAPTLVVAIPVTAVTLSPETPLIAAPVAVALAVVVVTPVTTVTLSPDTANV